MAVDALAYDGGGPGCFPFVFVAVGWVAAEDLDFRLRLARGGHGSGSTNTY